MSVKTCSYVFNKAVQKEEGNAQKFTQKIYEPIFLKVNFAAP